MKRAIKVVLGILAAVILVGIVTFCISESLVIRASKGQDYEDADYIIVLGAKVDPWGPSRALDDRLRAAYGYLEDHPDCRAVVTGGQGPDEHVSEGECMRDWLIEKGVDPERVIAECEADDTRENLRFSCALIEQDCGADWRTQGIVIVSSEYHLCRARYVGRHLLDYDFGTYPAPTSLPAYKLRYFIREALGMVYTRLFYI
ncbi:MAG: YdcF family protein [Firmicutes bacterium]|nr:YdcF family protein [Bacillota bacterium]